MNIINPVNHNSHHGHTKLPLPSGEPPCPVPSHIQGLRGRATPHSLSSGVGLGATEVTPSPAAPEALLRGRTAQEPWHPAWFPRLSKAMVTPSQPWENHTPTVVKHVVKLNQSFNAGGSSSPFSQVDASTMMWLTHSSAFTPI